MSATTSTELYGSPKRHLDVLAASVGRALELEFEERDSLHRGTYFWARKGNVTVRLQHNCDAEEGIPIVPDVAVPSLLWLAAGDDLEQVRSRLLASEGDLILIDRDSSL